MKLNVGCGTDLRPESEGWVNMDAFFEKENVVKHDMVETPWPFKDGQFDYVLCSHVLEHIPFLYVRGADRVTRDVLFLVLEELHRVIRPGGTLHVKVPYGGGYHGYCHPQHYRQWRPEWFAYLSPDHEENYYSTARFRMESWEIRKGKGGGEPRFPHAFRLGKSRIPLVSHIQTRFPRVYSRWFEKPSELDVKLVRV